VTDATADRTAWARASIRQMMALGVPLSDAMLVTERIIRNTPPGVSLDALPDEQTLERMATITDADIADARADWLLRARPEWRLLLDAMPEEPGA
jgi:hypothetical protein